MIVHQFVDHLILGDAISYHAVQLQALLKSLKWKSNIYVNFRSDDFVHDTSVRLIGEYDIAENANIVLYHHSIFSHLLATVCSITNARRGLIFHNITPPEFFPDTMHFRTKHIEGGYRQLALMDKIMDFAIADSTFNHEVLRHHGFRKPVIVIPPFVNLKSKFGMPRRLSRSKSEATKLISVSQFLYHKRQDDVIKLFRVYRELFNPNAELYLIGGKYTHNEFSDHIRVLVERTEGVCITGKIPLSQLIDHFRSADALISFSEHEGFGVPLVEAMYFGVPVLAFDAGAVRETLGTGGIIARRKDFLELSGILHEMITNTELRSTIIQNQQRELARFDYELISQELISWLVENSVSRS